MAKRYFKVLKGPVFFFVLLVALVCFAIVAEGPVEKIVNYVTGAAMIFAVVAFSIWMIKKPAKKITEETS
jgi:hypothetical protein